MGVAGRGTGVASEGSVSLHHGEAGGVYECQCPNIMILWLSSDVIIFQPPVQQFVIPSRGQAGAGPGAVGLFIDSQPFWSDPPGPSDQIIPPDFDAEIPGVADDFPNWGDVGGVCGLHVKPAPEAVDEHLKADIRHLVENIPKAFLVIIVLPQP